MKLSEVFEMLQYGELANVSMSGDIDEPSGIRVEDYPTLVSHINLALTDLHTKFNLKEKEVVIQQLDHITFYELDNKHAYTNTTDITSYKYIIDSERNPFINDVIRINSVYNELGMEVPVNDENNDYSIFLSNYKTLQIPIPSNENALFVLYRANHPKISMQNIDLNTEVEIPAYCVEALLSYVASRVHSQRTSQEAQATAVNLMSKYNLICNQLEEKNVLYNSPSNTNFKLGERGWV